MHTPFYPQLSEMMGKLYSVKLDQIVAHLFKGNWQREFRPEIPEIATNDRVYKLWNDEEIPLNGNFGQI